MSELKSHDPRLPQDPVKQSDEDPSELRPHSPSTADDDDDDGPKKTKGLRPFLTRSAYSGALLFNIITFTLPALYGTLAKLWIAQLDASAVATTDSYTYIGVLAEVLNEGLPRAAYLVIGDKTRTLQDRLNLCFTLIAFQISLGAIVSVAILGGASQFAGAFVPGEVRERTITYVRISAFQVLTSATTYSAAFATRAIDRPDVPLVINLTTTVANTILDFMFLSTFRIGGLSRPTLATQAGIRFGCDAFGAVAGLTYFILAARKILRQYPETNLKAVITPRVSSWIQLARPGAFTFMESFVRNAFYLWLVHGIVALGQDYATAWGVFNTIRWGLVMVPVYSLEAASGTFVGHAWSEWRRRALVGSPKATWADIFGPWKLRSRRGIVRPALQSVIIALIIEVPLCLIFSFALVRPFAQYLSNSDRAAEITTRMWRSIDWCYIFYAVNTQLASILLATRTPWYLLNSLVVNLAWVFPWATALQVGIPITESTAWRYHAIIFGGSMVLSFLVTLPVLGFWVQRLRAGKMTL